MIFINNYEGKGCLRGVEDIVLDCGFVVSEFEFYYVHFRTNTFGKGMNPLIPTPASYGLNTISTVLQHGRL